MNAPTQIFTTEHAQALITLAESAPLQNMRHAKETENLIQRFAVWYNGLQEAAKPKEVFDAAKQDPETDEGPMAIVPEEL